jgi:nucleotide-binding universal stress UspA family protein
MGGMAIITNLIGVNTVLGAFVAGILVGESPILTRQIDEQLRALTTALFMPVFFGLTGLHTDLSVLSDPSTLLLAVGLILIASVGKFGGAFAGAKIGRFSNAEAMALGCGMNARGSTEVIVATIGLSVGVLDQRLFSVIVAMAVVTTMAMPPTLRWALARLPMRDDERERLKQEEFEERSFLQKFERILLAIDVSASSHLAERIAGHFAAIRKTPVTVLDIVGDDVPMAKADKPGDPKAAEARVEDGAERVKAAADEAVAATADPKQPEPADIHITTKIKDANLRKILGEGAEKGHDLLFVGVDPTMATDGGFHEQLSVMTSAFKGTTAIVSSRGEPQTDKNLRILVPISGTERSTRAAELAFVIAKATECQISVLYIREPQQIRSLPRVSDASNAHVAAFKKIDEIARYNGVKVRKIVQEGSAPELSILRHARKGDYNLIVLGVSRRAGERLSYGAIADTLLETADRSFVFFETE